MKHNEQTKRIAGMEKRFDQAQKKVNALQRALSDYQEYLPEIQMLMDYYDSSLWQKDYQDDEAGLIPENLKRGVLSEDGVYNLIADMAAIREQLEQLRMDQ